VPGRAIDCSLKRFNRAVEHAVLYKKLGIYYRALRIELARIILHVPNPSLPQ
jgi:hypothetical protein